MTGYPQKQSETDQTYLTKEQYVAEFKAEEWMLKWKDISELLDLEAMYQQRVDSLSRRAQRLWEKSNVGEWFKTCTFDSWDNTRFPTQKAACMEYAESLKEINGQCLFLYGQSGVGKTHLATAVANYAVYELGISAYFTTYAGMVREIQKGFKGRRYDEEQVDVEKLAKSTGLLILDDLGKESITNWSEQILFDLVDTRYRAAAPMIITSNMAPEELTAKYDYAAISRLISMSKVMSMYGYDYRQERNKPAFEEVPAEEQVEF